MNEWRWSCTDVVNVCPSRKRSEPDHQQRAGVADIRAERVGETDKLPTRCLLLVTSGAAA